MDVLTFGLFWSFLSISQNARKSFCSFQSPSLHGVVWVGTLTEAIPIRPVVASDEAATLFPQQTVQEIWEKKFKEISDENPELSVTGIILFYPTYVLSYLEVPIDRLIDSQDHVHLNSIAH